MTKCANCSKEAVYVYNVSDTYQIYYCMTDLPKFLKRSNSASLLKSVIVPPAPAPKKKKSSSTPPAETVEN